MRKRQLVYGLLVVVLVFTTVQLSLYGAIPWLNVRDSQVSPHAEERALSDEDVLAAVRGFLLVCHALGLPVFLIDPDVLHRVVGNVTRAANHSCKYLCTGKRLTSFAVIKKVWNHQPSTLQAFRSAGFSVIYYYENDPDSLAGLSEGGRDRPVADTPTHYVFQHRGYAIHLVVFYERTEFWWHGQQHGRQPHGDTEAVLTPPDAFHAFSTHSGAFDEMELIKVTVDGLHLRAPRYPASFLPQMTHSMFLECNHSRARLFDSLHGPPISDPHEAAFVSNAKSLLQRAAQTLNHLHIRFWLSSGTCLGWFRQCDIIPHSLDVDLGIWIKDYDPRLVTSMEMSGLHLKHRFGKETDSLELSFQDGDVKLDIFFFYEEDDYMWNGGTETRNGKKYKYLFPKFTLCWTEFLDMKLRVPCDTEAYITANYGPNWFQPVKRWDWKSSPPNVRENGVWPQEQWGEVIQTF